MNAYRISSSITHCLPAGRQAWLSIAYCLLPFFSAAQFIINTSVTNVSCAGSSNGAAMAVVSGGATPYTYLWMPGGQATPSITGVPGGNYTVTVTDSTGNDSTISVLIFEPEPILDNAETNPPVCVNDGSILLSPAGGTAPFTFSWITGDSDSGIVQLAAGNYTVLITDANSCTAAFSYDLAVIDCFVTPESYFSPNDDGINDAWYITNSQYFDNARVIVFDRWGVKVFEHKGIYEPWNGKGNLGIAVPDAVYYYFFFLDKDDKKNNVKSGSVTIIR